MEGKHEGMEHLCAELQEILDSCQVDYVLAVRARDCYDRSVRVSVSRDGTLLDLLHHITEVWHEAELKKHK